MRLHVDSEPGGDRLSSWRVHAAVFALALVVRLVFQAGVVGLDTPPRDDAALYDGIATSVTNGGPYLDGYGYRSRRAPAFTFLLAGVYAATGHSWPAARVVQALLGALTCTVLLSLGDSWLGSRIGVTAALSCALFPFTVFWSGNLVTEPLCTLLTTASTWTLTRSASEARRTVTWSLLCALTALTRPNMGLLLPLGLPWLLRAPGRRWARVALAAGVFSLTLAPWTIRNYRVHLEFVPLTTMGGVVLWQGNNPVVAADPELRGRSLPGDLTWDDSVARLSEVDQDRLLFHRAIRFMNESAVQMPGLVGQKVLRLWNPFPQLDNTFQRWLASLSLLPVLILFAVGLAVAWAKRDKRVLPLLVPVLGVTLTAAIFWGDARIRAPADPMILLLASYGLWALLDLRPVGGPRTAGPSARLL